MGAFYFWLPLHPEKPWDHLPVGFAVPKVGPERPQFTQGGGDTPPGCPPMSPLSPLFWSHREGVKQPSLGVRAPPLRSSPRNSVCGGLCLMGFSTLTPPEVTGDMTGAIGAAGGRDMRDRRDRDPGSEPSPGCPRGGGAAGWGPQLGAGTRQMGTSPLG